MDYIIEGISAEELLEDVVGAAPACWNFEGDICDGFNGCRTLIVVGNGGFCT